MWAKNLLLTGRPGRGKTTLVEGLASRYTGPVGGFLTSEIRGRGVGQGFGISTLDGRTAVLAHVNLKTDVRVGKYGVDIHALDSVAVPAVRDAVANSGIILIDEIGRMELASDAFRQSALAALDSGIRATLAVRLDPRAHSGAVPKDPPLSGQFAFGACLVLVEPEPAGFGVAIPQDERPAPLFGILPRKTSSSGPRRKRHGGSP